MHVHLNNASKREREREREREKFEKNERAQKEEVNTKVHESQLLRSLTDAYLVLFAAFSHTHKRSLQTLERTKGTLLFTENKRPDGGRTGRKGGLNGPLIETPPPWPSTRGK